MKPAVWGKGLGIMSRTETEAENSARARRKAENRRQNSRGSKDCEQITRNAANRRLFSRKIGRLVVLIAVPAAALGIAILVYFHNPSLESRYYLPCFFHKLTGLYCPGCGNTRALYAALHFDFVGMLRYNAFFPVLAALLLWLLAGEYLKILFGRRILWFPKRIPLAAIAVFILAVIAFTILRNLPFVPFSYLAPGS